MYDTCNPELCTCTRFEWRWLKIDVHICLCYVIHSGSSSNHMSGMNDAMLPHDPPHHTQLGGLHMDAAITAQHPTAESAAQDFTEDSLESLMARLDEFKGPKAATGLDPWPGPSTAEPPAGPESSRGQPPRGAAGMAATGGEQSAALQDAALAAGLSTAHPGHAPRAAGVSSPAQQLQARQAATARMPRCCRRARQTLPMRVGCWRLWVNHFGPVGPAYARRGPSWAEAVSATHNHLRAPAG